VGSVGGYDRLKLNHNLLLDLRMREGQGTFTHDWADNHYEMNWQLVPTWTNEVGGASSLTFGAALNYLWMAAGASAAFDFTSEDFSMCAWAYPTSGAASCAIFGRGLLDTGGWEWYQWSTNLAFRSNQAGSRCGATAVGVVVLNQWSFFAFVRQGLWGQAYVNGLPVPMVQSVGGLLDPVTINETFYLANNSHDNNFIGKLWHPRIWNRQLSDREVASIWEAERGLWGI